MANELRYVATVKDGKPIIHGRKGFDQDLKAFEGEMILLKVSKYKKNRTLNQNGFYWYIFLQSEIDCFKEFWGETYSKEQVHDWNKTMFWGEEKLIESTGEIVKTPGSSADKTTVEFEERLEIARQWFYNKFEWIISLPGEQQEINY